MRLIGPLSFSSVTNTMFYVLLQMHYIPEVSSVVALEEEEEEASGEEPPTEEGGKSNEQKTYEQRLAAAGIPFSD
jgi:hypothetical protein